MGLNEAQLTETWQLGDKTVFEETYKTYFKPLHAYAYTMLKDEEGAEEVVQRVFLKLWEKKETIIIQTSLNAYLYKAIYFESLNVLKHEKIKSTYQSQSQYAMKHAHAGSAANHLHHRNLEEHLRKALREIPEQCRTVFQLSRFEELKYREIAQRLGISEKTVENHMSKALKLLRMKLADFITILTITWISIKNLMP